MEKSESMGLWAPVKREGGAWDLGTGILIRNETLFYLLCLKCLTLSWNLHANNYIELYKKDEKQVFFFLFTEASQEPELEPGLWSLTKQQKQWSVSSLTAYSCKDFGTWRGSLTLYKPTERCMVFKTSERMEDILIGGVGSWKCCLEVFSNFITVIIPLCLWNICWNDLIWVWMGGWVEVESK